MCGHPSHGHEGVSLSASPDHRNGNSHYDGDSANVTCDEGYGRKHGSNVMKCKDGNWTDQLECDICEYFSPLTLTLSEHLAVIKGILTHQ